MCSDNLSELSTNLITVIDDVTTEFRFDDFTVRYDSILLQTKLSVKMSVSCEGWEENKVFPPQDIAPPEMVDLFAPFSGRTWLLLK